MGQRKIVNPPCSLVPASPPDKYTDLPAFQSAGSKLGRCHEMNEQQLAARRRVRTRRKIHRNAPVTNHYVVLVFVRPTESPTLCNEKVAEPKNGGCFATPRHATFEPNRLSDDSQRTESLRLQHQILKVSRSKIEQSTYDQLRYYSCVPPENNVPVHVCDSKYAIRV